MPFVLFDMTENLSETAKIRTNNIQMENETNKKFKWPTDEMCCVSRFAFPENRLKIKIKKKCDHSAKTKALHFLFNLKRFLSLFSFQDLR